MSQNEINVVEAKCKEYREYKRLIEELEALKDAIADELKAVMTEAGQDKMIVGEYKLSFTDAKRETLIREKLEADLGDLSAYTKTSTYKIFKVA